MKRAAAARARGGSAARASALVVSFAALLGCAGAASAPVATAEIRPQPTTAAAESPAPSASKEGDGDKVAECNRLIAVINAGVASLEKGAKAEGHSEDGVADLKAMADAMDNVVREAEKVELTLPELEKCSASYQAMAKAVSRAARDMAAAADAKDVQKINAAQAAMEAAVKQEDPLVDSINKFCQAP